MQVNQVKQFTRRFGVLAATGLALAALTMTAGTDRTSAASTEAFGLTDGTPELKSAGALAFGPGSVLFVGDTASATVHAVDVQDTATDTGTAAIKIDDIDKKIAAALGTTADDILIRDMKVHKPSQHIYLSVQRGRGANATPVLLRAMREGKIERVPLENIKYASAAINNAPAVGAKTERGQDLREMSITGLAFVNDEVFVAGLSKQEFASDLRRISFPFNKGMASTSVEIFHTSHNKYETHSPITAFVPIKLKGVPTLLAGYGCAPLATFAIDALKDGQHVRGQTLAELGGGNRPLDMISFVRDGKPVVIVANSSRTLMRIKTEDLEKQAPMTTAVESAYVSGGAPYVSIAQVGILQLDDLNAEHAVVIQRDINSGALNLVSLTKKWM
jgi:hypothetical protein